MASDLVSVLDATFVTLDALTGVTAYLRADLEPNALPTTPYLVVELVPGGVLNGGFSDSDFGFFDITLQLTMWSDVSFNDADDKLQLCLTALRAAGWQLDSSVGPHPDSGMGWRGWMCTVRLTAGADS